MGLYGSVRLGPEYLRPRGHGTKACEQNQGPRIAFSLSPYGGKAIVTTSFCLQKLVRLVFSLFSCHPEVLGGYASW